MNETSPLHLKPLEHDVIIGKMAESVLTQLSALTVLPSAKSTNSTVLEQPIELAKATVCLAEAQTAGRGRRGNHWLSAANRNIMLSLGWGFKAQPQSITSLGLAVALVVADRLNQQFNLSVKIKWPNDLMVDDAKLAGVLIDVAGQSQGVCNVVIGLGLNVSQPEWSRSDVDYPWQDLLGLGVDVDRNILAATLVSDLIDMLNLFEQTGFTPMAEHWNALSAYQERRVSVGDEQSIIEGLVQGVDANGALLILDDDGIKHQISNSSLSVRLL